MKPKLADIEAIYHAALEKTPGADRAAFLAEACGNSQALYAQIQALLETSEQTGKFLESPVFCPDDLSLDGMPVTEGPGSHIGPYKLLEKIGEGGMAEVYMAAQERPLRRRVALKIIKLGMDTKQVMARFEAERQVLAMMEHPNIARVFDAGATDAGRPFFVMELVRGISITKYCDQHKLSTAQRLELYIPVCKAVQHAHQKGIIHRDLKPTNILVTMRDGQPVPKVIDFGIAKATNQRLTEQTVFTRFAEMIGTPEYMSPEQAEMSELDIDTRTDVYSLGIVLYELLTGALPFDGKTLRAAALGEIQRIIREEEPPRPSTRLSTLGEAAAEIAARRGTNVVGLTRRLNRELEWIPMKAMRKDRTRRYQSASEFADDIGNYLSDTPLIAGPESASYRLAKLVNRHRVVFCASAAVLVSLIVGLAVSSYLFAKAQKALNDLNRLEARVEADEILTSVQDLRAQGGYEDGLAALAPHLETPDLGPKAQLIYAQILFDMGNLPEARERLNRLTSGSKAIAGSAHYLLAHIALQNDPNRVAKHQQLAESLLPHTVEAFTLRAMVAVSPEEALQWLSEAQELDSRHYASRRARALVYYHLREYSSMAEDAGALVALRPGDYLGYALRAIVRQEAGNLEGALEDHTKALQKCPVEADRAELYYRRWQSHMRSGSYQAALMDAKRLQVYERGPFPVFDSLLARKEFNAAQEEYQRVVAEKSWSQHYIKQSIVKHTFNVLQTGRDIEFPPDVALMSPFYTMKQGADLYELLQKKGRPINTGFRFGSGALSPDGRHIAYSQAGGNSWRASTLHANMSQTSSPEIAVLNVETGKRQLLGVHGAGPRWSPDGRHIAFQRNQSKGEEIWLVPAAGGAVRKIASGVILGWSQDARRLYYWGKPTRTIYAVDVTLPESEGVPVMEDTGDFRWRSSLSPDTRHLAVSSADALRVLTFPEGREVARWKKPWPVRLFHYAWHPSGKSILLNAWWHYGDMGMGVLDLAENEMTHVLNLNGPKCDISLSADGTRLLVSVQGIAEECWLLDMHPGKSFAEILGPALTSEQLLTQLLDQYSRIISSDTPSAKHYLSRALVYFARGDLDMAHQDIHQCDALIQSANGPAVINLLVWASRYHSAKRYREAEILLRCLGRLAERFPERFPHPNQPFKHPFQQLVKLYTTLGDQEQAAAWQKRWQGIQDTPED